VGSRARAFFAFSQMTSAPLQTSLIGDTDVCHVKFHNVNLNGRAVPEIHVVLIVKDENKIHWTHSSRSIVGVTTIATWTDEAVTIPSGILAPRTLVEALLFNSQTGAKIDYAQVPYELIRVPSRFELKMIGDGAILVLSVRLVLPMPKVQIPTTSAGETTATTSKSPSPQPHGISRAVTISPRRATSPRRGTSPTRDARPEAVESPGRRRRATSPAGVRAHGASPRGASGVTQRGASPRGNADTGARTRGVSPRGAPAVTVLSPIDIARGARAASPAPRDAAQTHSPRTRHRTRSPRGHSPRGRSPPARTHSPAPASPAPEPRRRSPSGKRALSTSPTRVPLGSVNAKRVRDEMRERRQSVASAAEADEAARLRAEDAAAVAAANSANVVARSRNEEVVRARLDEAARVRAELDERYRGELDALKQVVERERRALQETERTLHARLRDIAELRQSVLLADVEGSAPATTLPARASASLNAITSRAPGSPMLSVGSRTSQLLGRGDQKSDRPVVRRCAAC
jgi:hypothetical protein